MTRLAWPTLHAVVISPNAGAILTSAEFLFLICNVLLNKHAVCTYRKIPKFSDARKLCRNLPKIETKRPNLRVFGIKDANGMANSEDPDQTAPLGAV